MKTRGESEQIWEGILFTGVCISGLFVFMYKGCAKLKKYTNLYVKSMDFFVAFY